MADLTTPDHSDASILPTPAASTPSTTPGYDLYTALAKHSLTPALLTQIRDSLISLALHAGSLMLSVSPSIPSPIQKRNTADLVTTTDRAIESYIQSSLSSSYPSIKFLGEETYKHGDALSASPTFIIDPIDGTLNFVHGFPNTCISLALAVEKKPVVGVVYNPFRWELYSAVKNEGAFLTTGVSCEVGNTDRDKEKSEKSYRLPLRPIPPPLALESSLVALEWGTERSGANWELRTSVSKCLLSSPTSSSSSPMVHSVRSSGSAALDFCYVAAGQIDFFWEGGCWAWDVCAGWCILEEAGGIVASANPGDWEPEVEGRCYFAVRGAKRSEQREVVEGVWELMGDRKFQF